MPFTVTMPKLSPTMEEGTIAKWHKKEGDQVESGDLLIEVATDKATVEYNALDGGWLKKILIPEGKGAIVNQAIAIFTEEAKESIDGYKPTGVQPEKPQPKKEAVVSDEQSVATKEHAEQRSGASYRQPDFIPEQPLTNYQFESPEVAANKRIAASPLAKKLAKEKGLDLSTLKGSGPSGRIVSKDLERAQPSGTVAFSRREAPQDAPGSYEEVALTPIRKVIAQRLQESKSFIPHFYVQQTVDAQPLIAIRDQLAAFEVKVTFNDLIVRAAALALTEHPNINSGFNSANQSIIMFKTIDISIAVSLPTGLITPIVRHADFKNVGEISLEIKNLAKRAKEGKLEPHEYKGGSFTVSNLGMYGVTDFQAIINPPQAAILAVSGILDTPVIKNGQVVPGKTMNLTLSVDHRVIDGAAAADFMKTLKRIVENPAVVLV